MGVVGAPPRGCARGSRADGVDPDDVIMSPERAAARGLTSTVTFVRGNLAPEGAIVKSTAIDRSTIGADGVYRLTGTARVFTSERDAIAAIKSHGADRIAAGTVMVLAGRGPLGAGMEETYQVTSALKYLDVGRSVALITDARFSGVSTGPCIGHVGPEALAGGPIGKLRDGDRIRVVIDCRRLEGTDRSGRARRVGRRTCRRRRHAQRAHATRDDLAPGPRAPRRHAPLGRAAAGERRDVGRVCL